MTSNKQRQIRAACSSAGDVTFGAFVAFAALLLWAMLTSRDTGHPHAATAAAMVGPLAWACVVCGVAQVTAGVLPWLTGRAARRHVEQGNR